MDFAIQTGATRSSAGTVLFSRSFQSGREQACLLLQARVMNGDSQTLENECVAVMKHALLGTEGEPWVRLDGTLKEMNGLFKGLMAGDAVSEIHAVVALADAMGSLHVSHAGRGEAWLLRGGAASQITEFTRGKPLPNFVHISSGALEPGDVVIFSTQRLMRAVTPAQLAQLTAASDLIPELVRRLQAEDETAAVATLDVRGKKAAARSVTRFEEEVEEPAPSRRRSSPPSRRGRRKGIAAYLPLDQLVNLRDAVGRVVPFFSSIGSSIGSRGANGLKRASSSAGGVSARFMDFLSDLRHPERKRRAHLLLLAAALAAFLILWMIVSLATLSQRNKTQAELEQLIDQIQTEIQTAENRRLSGDITAANAILEQAEGRAKQVIDSESGLFRGQAVDLLSQIRDKRETINNITRISEPTVLADLATKNPDISALGIIGLEDNEQTVFDSLQAYPIIAGTLSDPTRISEQELLRSGTSFARYQSQVFLTAGSSVLELIDGQVTAMKTEDPNGWVTGRDIETYSRFLYILTPDAKQIYKYERLSNRYGSPVNYNVNADLSNALDMTIDTSVYVLKQGGEVLRLLRGEVAPFTIRQMPEQLLATTTKIFKVTDGSLYFLDPDKRRVIVVSNPDTAGEASYVRQYVLDDPSITGLRDIYVDPDESHIFVLDETKVYQIDAIR